MTHSIEYSLTEASCKTHAPPMSTGLCFLGLCPGAPWLPARPPARPPPSLPQQSFAPLCPSHRGFPSSPPHWLTELQSSRNSSFSLAQETGQKVILENVQCFIHTITLFYWHRGQISKSPLLCLASELVGYKTFLQIKHFSLRPQEKIVSRTNSHLTR